MADFKEELIHTLPKLEEALQTSLPKAAAESSVLDSICSNFEEISPELERYLYGPYRRFSETPGKRVRPFLATLGAKIAGANPKEALAAGIAVETFQTAALIHDDIADDSKLRRGQPCLHIQEGVGLAINVGDLALTRVVELILEASYSPEVRLALIQELMDMQRKTLVGQALDLGWARDARWDIHTSAYLYMAAHKTAYYSAATPLVLGAIIGGARAELIQLLRSFGLLSGLAFQLKDDLLNIVGEDRATKDFRNDIVEGKRTLLVIYTLNNADAEDARLLTALLEKEEKTKADVDQAVALMEKTGAITYVENLAQELIERSIAELDRGRVQGLLDNNSYDLLKSMADFFVSRTN